MKISVLTFGLLCCFSFLSAQQPDKVKLDSLFTALENREKGMGSVSVFYDGKEMYQRSYGYADVENKVKADAGTKYRIGSITKTFTATLVMKSIEEGMLSLSAKLDAFYPGIKNANKITIQHLLQHRSGISNFTDVADYMQWNTERHTKDELLERIMSGGIRFEPGEKLEYSNSNYVLLTFILEDVTRKKISELLDEIIIRPCQLKNTYIGDGIDPAKNEAYSYRKLATREKEKETSMSIPLGAGFLVSTPTDLNIFLNFV